MPESEPKPVKKTELISDAYMGKKVRYHGHEGILGKHELLDIPVVNDNGMSLAIASGDPIEIEGDLYIVRAEGSSDGGYEPMRIDDVDSLIVDDIPTEELRLKDNTARIELDRIRKESERRKKAWLRGKEDKYGEEAP